MSGLVRAGLWTLGACCGCALAGMAWQRNVLGHATGPVTPVLFGLGAACVGLLWSPATRAGEHVGRWGWRVARRDAWLWLRALADRQAAAAELARAAREAHDEVLASEQQRERAEWRTRRA